MITIHWIQPFILDGHEKLLKIAKNETKLQSSVENFDILLACKYEIIIVLKCSLLPI